MTHFAHRLEQIQPFHVMAILARARELEAQGRSIVHMEIGEPDFVTPAAILEAGRQALAQGLTHYTPTLGLTALRQAIAASYAPEFELDPARVVVTPGASGALQLVFAALVNPGDEVLLADPGYPCNRHFVRLFEGKAVNIAVDATSAYQLTPEHIRRHWGPRTVAVLLATPSNPTGTVIEPAALRAIADTVQELGGVLIVDEIYHGLTYGVQLRSALELGEQVFVVNSFSKYYGMTGWRLGWLVAPAAYLTALDKLAQISFIAPSTPAQHAALAAFRSEVRDELERRRLLFQARRDYLLPALQDLGFVIAVVPQGAFYLYADCSALTQDSEDFAMALLEQAGVAITPGVDFGDYRAQRHVRFSYANTMENLQLGVQRMRQFLGK